MERKALKKLLEGVSHQKIIGDGSTVVKGISFDSRKVSKDFLFVAVKGLDSDGHKFIPEAIKKGAKVVVSEKEVRSVKGVTVVGVKDSREALAKISANWFNQPSKKLKVIGVTGTKGKTTTCYIIHHILSNLEVKAGLATSIGAKIVGEEIDTGFHTTTPDVITLNSFLKKMVDKKCKYAVLEVSSHGISQKRIAGIDFDVAALTNLAPEHLDYHKSLSEYKRTKLSFLKKAKVSLVCPSDTKLKILPGHFNNLNAELALRIVEKLGFNRKKAIEALKSFKLPKGRLEEIDPPAGGDKGIKIVVDFAHTPDSLEAVLKHLKSETKGKLISVFGSAGERDKKKRPKMGQISAKYCDISIITAEDPRSEDIHKIITSIAVGARKAGAKEIEPWSINSQKGPKVFIRIPERKEAIFFAINSAKKGDTVLITGKAHEKSMAFDGIEHPWSDYEAIKEALLAKNDIGAIILAAGRGTRMKVGSQKVLRKIAGRPMVSYTLSNLREARFKEVVAVVRHKKKEVIKNIKGLVKFADQNETLGTGHAVAQGIKKINKNIKTVLVINGDDSAFYKPETIKRSIEEFKAKKATLLFTSLLKENPKGLGRVFRDRKGKLLGIVEDKDATEEQKRIKEVNNGLYIFDKAWLEKNLGSIKKSSVEEYYIVDLVKIALDHGKKVLANKLTVPDEWHGVNTPEELKIADKKKRRLINNLMN